VSRLKLFAPPDDAGKAELALGGSKPELERRRGSEVRVAERSDLKASSQAASGSYRRLLFALLEFRITQGDPSFERVGSTTRTALSGRLKDT
jgi:hypothetical protein